MIQFGSGALDLNILIYEALHTKMDQYMSYYVCVCFQPCWFHLRNRIAMGVHTMHVCALELALVSAHKSPSSFCRFRVTGCYDSDPFFLKTPY